MTLTNDEKISKALVLLSEVRDALVGNRLLSTQMQNCTRMAMIGIQNTAGVMREGANALEMVRQQHAINAKAVGAEVDDDGEHE